MVSPQTMIASPDELIVFEKLVRYFERTTELFLVGPTSQPVVTVIFLVFGSAVPPESTMLPRPSRWLSEIVTVRVYLSQVSGSGESDQTPAVFDKP